MTEEQRARFAEALKRLAGDEELFVAMGAMVLDDAPSMIADLKNQIQKNELTEVASIGHKLKGLLSTFETGNVVLTIQQIITAAKEDDQNECQALIKSARPGFDRLFGEIREVVDPIAP